MIGDLLAKEARLDRSFTAAIVVFLLQAGWPLAARTMGGRDQAWVWITFLVLWLLFLAAYIWFAVAAAAAAGCVGRSRVFVGAWIVAAPFLALLPIPFVSLIVGASPLSIKFVLSGELRALIQEKTLEQ
jgi:hypothetical protein